MSQPQLTTRTLTVESTDELGFAEPFAGETACFALVAFCGQEAELAALSASRPVVVGRRAPSEILLDDPAVSRQHARFTVRDGEVFVEDLGSRNGTLIDGRRITSRQRISPGTQVQVGPAVVTLVARRGTAKDRTFTDRVIVNPAMKELYRIAERAAGTTAPALILGETGTGKEHLAKTLHAVGARRAGPFLAVNCGAIPASLTESTLFGHERGAFTGAVARSEGVFEQASGGVLFLDEVGEMPMSVQAALLRVLETSEIRRVGGNRDIPVDVRVVAATHCDIARMIADGSFREDLYYRLSTLVFDVPPLRERRDEIEPLARQFLREARAEWGSGPDELSPETLRTLESYDWPGNIRQLRHVIQRAVLLGQTDRIQLPGGAAPSLPRVEAGAPGSAEGLRDALDEYEGQLIAQALARAGGNRGAAAKLLRVPERTLSRKLKEHGFSDKRTSRVD
jgi:DNA-binding NtrC family response regulator